MAYGIEVVIPKEIGELTFKIANLNLEQNEESLITELDFIEERRKVAAIRDTTLKGKIMTMYNMKVILCTFEKEDLVLQKAFLGGKNNH